MDALKFFAGMSGLAMASACFGSLPSNNDLVKKELVQLHHLGKLQAGDSIDLLPSLAKAKTEIKKAHCRSRFHVYYFNPQLPKTCMNYQCGAFAVRVVSQGGFLMGGADSDYLRDAGLDPSSSIVLITDRKDRVETIYRDVSQGDLETIFQGLRAYR